jgi:isoleucyl-tRNA synthetase
LQTGAIELIQEGLAREVISKVQNMRKNAGFELTDRIELKFTADDEVAAVVKAFEKYVAEETLAVSVKRQEQAEAGFNKWDINGHAAELQVVKSGKVN